MTAPAGSYQVSAVTHNKINLTPYTKATVNLITYTFNGSGYHRFAVIDSQSGITNAVLYADVSRLGEITVDLTNITGEHYFGIYLSSQSGAGCVIDFNYVWLEV